MTCLQRPSQNQPFGCGIKLPTYTSDPLPDIVAGMFTYDNWQPHATPAAYETPCGRYSVERTGAERFDVYGPAGFIDWFVTRADAKVCADGHAQTNPVKLSKK
jgi:hypothetical protein